MQDEKLIELFEFYAGGGKAEKLPDEVYSLSVLRTNADDHHEARGHVVWMAQEAIGFVEEARRIEDLPLSALEGERIIARYEARSKREKAMRWLGFIQGVLWMSGVYTLDDLKEHSRQCSDEPERAETKVPPRRCQLCGIEERPDAGGCLRSSGHLWGARSKDED